MISQMKTCKKLKGLDEKSAELLFWVKSVAKGHGQDGVILDDLTGTIEI